MMCVESCCNPRIEEMKDQEMVCSQFNYKRKGPCTHPAKVLVSCPGLLEDTPVCVGHALVIYRWLVVRDNLPVKFLPVNA